MSGGQGDTHLIRLRGPWEGPHGRIKLPAAWSAALGDEPGPVTLTRRFNRPTFLAEFEVVFLRVASPHTILSVRLNDLPLEDRSDRVDVSAQLAEANRLAVELRRAGDTDEPLLVVRLEIEDRAYPG